MSPHQSNAIAIQVMERWNRFFLIIALTTMFVWNPCALAVFDDTERDDESSALTEWLTQAGLDEILAVMLDEQVRKAATTNPAAIARLSDTYLRLISNALDEDRVADLRKRVEKFLSRNQVPSQFKLQIALGRADYRMALRGIERLRQGQVKKDDKAQTVASLLYSLQSLDQLFEQLKKQIEELRLLAAGTDDQQRIALRGEIDDASDLLMEAKFLRTWCRYWLLWIDRPFAKDQPNPASPWRRQATEIVSAWSDLLETGKPLPEPSDCSTDLLSEQYYSQSILGMALTKSLQSDLAVADGWFALLRQSGVWEGLSDSSGWYLQALVDTGSYDLATAFLAKSSETLNCPSVVGAAVRAVEESSSNPQAIEFAKAAVAVAAIQGDFGSVRRIARKIPVLAEGDSFSACLARGIDLYDQGRAAEEPKLKKSFLETAALELSLAVKSAPKDRQTAAAVQELLAWSQRGAGQPCEAAESFLFASNQLAGNRADESLWNAVESLIKGGCPDAIKSKDSRGYVLAREYLDRFESGNHTGAAAALLSQSPQAENDDMLAERLMRDALREGESSPLRESASSLLYRRFRAAQGSDRAKEANRLLSIPLAPISSWKTNSMDIVVRQQLEAALDSSATQIDEAKKLLQLVAKRYPIGEEPIEFRCELAVRRLALANATQNFEMLTEAIAAVRKVSDMQWRAVAEGIFIRTAELMIQQGVLTPQQTLECQFSLVTARRSFLDTARKSADSQRADMANIQLGLALLNAARTLRSNVSAGISPPAGFDAQALSKEALAISKEILDHRPDDAQAFALMADAGIASGDFNAAFEALSRLVGALPARSDAWFERKADLCELMVKSDPDEVRKILTQHVVLIPDWGPGVGGVRLKALADRLGIVSQQTPVEGKDKQ
ncbi:MAG: hypothetical protein O3B75_06415 [Planctomycetota bacterium]|nr:hypothetical protein [Planctomycetota bacterium]